MVENHSIYDLEVIGFGDVLDSRDLPAILPPIYRVRNSSIVLFPPSMVQGDVLAGAHESDMPEFQAFLAKQEVSALERPFDAKPHHELWIDPEGRVHYEDWDQASDRLREIAWAKIGEADREFRENHLEEADILVSQAMNANDGILDAYVLKGAIRSRQGMERSVTRIAEMASEFCSTQVFQLLLQNKVLEGDPGLGKELLVWKQNQEASSTSITIGEEEITVQTHQYGTSYSIPTFKKVASGRKTSQKAKSEINKEPIGKVNPGKLPIRKVFEGPIKVIDNREGSGAEVYIFGNKKGLVTSD